jgi:hypothetical protein
MIGEKVREVGGKPKLDSHLKQLISHEVSKQLYTLQQTSQKQILPPRTITRAQPRPTLKTDPIPLLPTKSEGKKPGRIPLPVQRFETHPEEKLRLLKLTWAEPRTYGTRIKAYEVNIKAKNGNWLKSKSCTMQSQTIY